MINKTKIISTVGPVSQDIDTLTELVKNGTDIIRINLAYTDLSFCDNIKNKLDQIDGLLGTYTSLMIELKGPIINVGPMKNGEAFYKKNDKIRVYVDELLGDNTKISISYPGITNDLKTNDIIKLSNGLVEFKILEKIDNYVLCQVINEGIVKEYTTIKFPNCNLKIPFLQSIDLKIIDYVCKNNIDFLSLPGVKNAEDVLKVNDLLIENNNSHTEIISRVDNYKAIENIDEIIKLSDAILIHGKDLGIEFPIERVPSIQKMIINKCHTLGKASIVATEFLSAIENEINPTRAEVSDIASAVLESVDAIMLSTDTTIGKYPVETVKTLERIVKTAENDVNYSEFLDKASRTESKNTTGLIAFSVAECSVKLKCKAIVAPTISGYTALKMSRFRPSCPIIAVSPNIETIKRLNLYYGIKPVLIKELNSLDKIMDISKKLVKELIEVFPEDKIIITGGYPFKEVKHTNFMQIEEY